MKQFILSIALLIAAFTASAQDHVEPRWTFKHRDAILLTAYTESDSANVVNLSKKDLKAGKYFFTYTGVNKDSGLVRTLTIVDPADREVYQCKEGSFTLTAKQLKKLIKDAKTLRIYTMAIPSDPAKAAIVRVRRVHLCTLQYR